MFRFARNNFNVLAPGRRLFREEALGRREVCPGRRRIGTAWRETAKMSCATVLLLFCFFCTGCDAPKEAPGSPPPSETEVAAAPEGASAGASEAALPYRVALDDFSNLQSEEADVPLYDARTLAERRAQGLPRALPEITPYRKGKTVYLTFDDGPDGKNTPAILDILAENGVKGTFYVLGRNAAAHPETMERMLREGHAIGNHSYDHDYDRLYASPDSYLEEMEQTDEILHGLLGLRPLITRAPGGRFGHFSGGYERIMEENGYVEHDWNVSSADADPNHPVARDFIDNIDAQTDDGKDSAIILMHSSENHEETVKALPEIIRILKEKGYRFGVVTPMTPQPW